MNNLPLVSVIIVNWNGGEIFKKCLQSLSKIYYSNWELIVVDNGSQDGSDKFVSNLKSKIKCQLIYNKNNVGFAKANNQGFKKSNGKYVLLLNNDTKVTPNFLGILVTKMEKDILLGVVQPKICLMDKPGYLDNAGSFFTKIGFLQHWGYMERDQAEFNQEREIFSAKGACMLIRKVLIEKIGLFDNDFISYFEESDFCWRVWLVGYRVLFYPQAKIFHKVGFTIRRLNVGENNYHYYKNRICSLIKNLENNNLLIVVLNLLVSLGIMIIFFLRFHPNDSLMIGKAVLWNLHNLSKTIKKRRIIQKWRKKSDSEIFTNLMHNINWRENFNGFKRIEADLRKDSEKKSNYWLEKKHFANLDHIWWGAQTQAGQRRYNQKAEIFKNICNLNKNTKILEIGCGDGEFTKRIVDLNLKITATDVTEKLLDRGRKYLKNPNISFRVENCEKLSFRNESFDIICGVSILHHVALDKTLQEVYRVLKKRGKIFFTEPNIFNPHILMGLHIPWIRKKMEFSPNETALSRRKVKLVLEQIGFKEVKVDNYDFLHPSTPGFMINLMEKISVVLERTPIIKEISGSLLIYAKK